MTTDSASVAEYETRVMRFKPEHGLVPPTTNDLRSFLYDWFAHFEHAAPTDFYLSHLDDGNMDVQFPGSDAISSHAGFIGWYENLLAQTLWNFHDIHAIQIKKTTPQEYLVTFVVNWYGEVKADSDQLAGWQSRSDSFLFHHFIRQTWTMKVGDGLVIRKLVAAAGDTPSPIAE
jgi:hypothetical protein